MIKMHKDILGNDIVEGDVIAYPLHNRLKIGTVHKCTPKMVTVIPAGKQYWDKKYPHEIIKINDSKVSLFFIKNTK